MSEENKNLKVCKSCGKKMAKSAKTCPNCGAKNKKPFYTRWWFILIVVIVIISAVSQGNKNKTTKTDTASATQSAQQSQVTGTEQPKQEKTVEYTSYTVSELIKDLDDNAMKAKEKYADKYVEITGKISNFDSDGKYIGLSPTDDEFTLTNIQCYIKNDEQKTQITNMSKGDIVTVKGKMKSVGEVMGYSLDIDSVVAK